jgi:hypothetical protein
MRFYSQLRIRIRFARLYFLVHLVQRVVTLLARDMLACAAAF